MIYTVIWLPAAVAQLARHWNRAGSADRAAITQANYQIDQDLRVDPDMKVTPCGKLWIYSATPLDVLCDIDPTDRKVHIIQVRLTP